MGVMHDHAIAAFQSMMRQSDIFEIVGYCKESSAPDSINPSYLKYPCLTKEEILNIPDLDAVVIETRELELTEYALAAARRGLHIHMDKPGGASLSDFEELISEVKKRGTVFHTGYMYRYNRAVMEALEMVRSGALGEIISVEAQMNCLHKPEKRQWLADLPGGMMFYLGCHLVDLVYSIQGEPTNIIPMNKSTGKDGVTALDYGFAILEYPHGVSMVKTSANEPCGFMRRQLVITGTKGTVELNPIERYLPEDDSRPQHLDMVTDIRVSREDQIDIANWKKIGKYKATEPQNRYDGMLSSFAAMVRGEKENPYSYDYELSLYKLVLRASGV